MEDWCWFQRFKLIFDLVLICFLKASPLTDKTPSKWKWKMENQHFLPRLEQSGWCQTGSSSCCSAWRGWIFLCKPFPIYFFGNMNFSPVAKYSSCHSHCFVTSAPHWIFMGCLHSGSLWGFKAGEGSEMELVWVHHPSAVKLGYSSLGMQIFHLGIANIPGMPLEWGIKFPEMVLP